MFPFTEPIPGGLCQGFIRGPRLCDYELLTPSQEGGPPAKGYPAGLVIWENARRPWWWLPAERRSPGQIRSLGSWGV